MADEMWGLADAIAALRRELADAMVAGEQDGLKFKPKPIELTIQAVVTKGGDGRIGWGILGVGGKLESAETHVLKIQLEPVLRTELDGYTTDFTVTDVAEEKVRFGEAK